MENQKRKREINRIFKYPGTKTDQISSKNLKSQEKTRKNKEMFGMCVKKI